MYRDYLELPVVVRILCCGALINRAGSFVLIFLTIYASEELGFGVPFATACIGVLGFGSMIGAVLGGHFADLWGRRTVMLSAMFGGGCVLVLLAELENRWAFMQAMSTLSIHIRQSGFSNLQFGWLMSINGLMIFALQLPMTHWLSRFPAMSVLESGGLLISIGFVLNRYGPRALWIGTFGVALTAVAIYYMIHRTITQRVEDGEHE